MANKTKPNKMSVREFLKTVEDKSRLKDCMTITRLMKKRTGKNPKMWGPSMVGFGSYHYKYATGREGDWFLTGFSPRKQNLTVYLMCGFDQLESLMKKLGKYKTGKSCLYFKSLDDIDIVVLEKMINESVSYLRESHNS